MQMIINENTYPIYNEKSVLEVAQREGIPIPTLCHHPALDSYGACRLCVVEVLAGGRPGITASCVLPVVDGLVVATDSPKVRQARKILLQLLLASCPGSQAVMELAAGLGVTETPYEKGAVENECVLCGQCVRVCEKIGARAIGFAFRGPKRKVTGPWDKTPDACLACRACENICPTGLIKFNEEVGKICGEPWHSKVGMISCSRCGRPVSSEPLLAHVNKASGQELTLCLDCRKEDLGRFWLGKME